jgi:hypothetical protein
MYVPHFTGSFDLSYKALIKGNGVAGISGDLRIIWDFDEDKKQIIILFAIAQHSKSYREYK